MSKYIYDIIEQGEHQQLDFKFEINDARKIARTLSAFSNTDGGKLLIGVKDNGKVSGVRTEEEYYMLEAAAQMYCKPEVDFKVQKWDILGKTVLEVDIPKLVKRPSLAMDYENRWLAYLRVRDQNFLANRVLVRVWQMEKRKRGILVEYSQTEEQLLEYLQVNEYISISKFCRIGKIQLHQAEEILTNLIVFDVIGIEVDEKGARYKLIPVD